MGPTMRARVYFIVVLFLGVYLVMDYLSHQVEEEKLQRMVLELQQADELIYDLGEETEEERRQALERGRRRGELEEALFSHQAFVTLCVGDNAVQGALVLFHSLKKVGTRRQFAIMSRNISEANQARIRSFGIQILPNKPLSIPLISADEGMEERDQKLMSKLRVWELVQFQKVVQMDSDMIALRNVDELFLMPEISACAMADSEEKILFFERAGPNATDYLRLDPTTEQARLLPGWSGLNSGIVVLEPSLETFSHMMEELARYPRRVCCPSQEFVYNFFLKRRRFFRLPTPYNTRRLGNIRDPHQLRAAEANAKVYHFVEGIKPWGYPPGERSKEVEEWWRLSREVDDILLQRGLGIVEADPAVVRRT